jgi:hypothetical protein
VPDPGADRQPDPETLKPAEAAEAEDQEDEAKPRPRDGVRETLEPLQSTDCLRGRRPVGPADRFDHSRRQRVGKARPDGWPCPPRNPEYREERFHRGDLAIDLSGAVPEDLTGYLASGAHAEQRAQRRRARVEADGHPAKRL